MRGGDWHQRQMTAIAWKRFQCGRIVATLASDDGRLTKSWSHRLIIRSATALRRNPRDVAIGILHVAGFAVDAILGVDDEARSGRFLDPLINGGRAIPTGRAGIDVVLRGLLQAHVGQLEMYRLGFF